jgi:hypothetical protein
MTIEPVAAGTARTMEQAQPPVAERRRFSMPMIVAAVIMFLVMCSYTARGVSLLLHQDVFGGQGVVAVVAGALTPEGREVILGGVHLFFAAVALAVLIGFLLKRTWAWSAAMTWTAISLLIGLVSYFTGDPGYLNMLGAVVLLLVLNQASVHQEFRIEGR